MKYPGQISNTLGLQFFQLYRYGILFLIGLLFTKSYLTTSEIGIYESLIFIASAISFFWISGVSQSLLSLYKDPGEKKKSDVFFNSFLLMTSFSLLAFAVLWIFINQFSEFLQLSGNVQLLKLISFYILFVSPSYLIEYIYLLKNKAKRIIVYGIVSYTLQLVLVALPVLLDFPLIIAVKGLVVIAILRFAWLIIVLIKYSIFKINFPFLKEHIVIGLPLIFSALLSGAGVYIDGIIIRNYFDSATFAVFRYGAKEFPLFLLLANAFSNSFIPEIKAGDKLEGGLKRIRDKSLKMMHYLFPLAMILVLSSHTLYPIVYNENFLASASVFNIYLLLIICRLVFPQTIVIGLKKTKVVLYISIIEFIVNVGISLLLISSYGILGVAFGTLVAHFMEKILLIIYASMKLKISPKKYIPIYVVLSYSVILMIFYLVVELYF